MNAIKTERLIIRHIEADDWRRIKEIWAEFHTSVFPSTTNPMLPMMKMFGKG